MDYAETIQSSDGKFYVISKMRREINRGPMDRELAVWIATQLCEAYAVGQRDRAAMVRAVLMMGDE